MVKFTAFHKEIYCKMQRIALGIEYDGANYSGWQKQHHCPSIQTHLEKALSQIATVPISVICAGRTDARVHASGQIIHFDTPVLRQNIAWIKGVNTHLPHDIRVLWAKEVDSAFNARRSAISRRYCYVIVNRPISPGILRQGASWVREALDETLMQEGAQYLLGTHDFNAFRATQCQAKSSVRNVTAINVKRQGSNIIIDISANAFLHHMVRNITGTLLMVGQKKYPPVWVKEVLASKDRKAAGFTAPPQGLYLIKVCYPSHFEIPEHPCLPWFL